MTDDTDDTGEGKIDCTGFADGCLSGCGHDDCTGEGHEGWNLCGAGKGIGSGSGDEVDAGRGCGFGLGFGLGEYG